MSGANFLERLLDGVAVEWKSISEIFHLRNGYTPSKSNSEYWKNGTIPWFRMEDIRENGQILSSSLQQVSTAALKGGNPFPANSIIIATSATIGEHALVTIPFLANQRFTCLTLQPDYIEKFNIKFVFYYCYLLADWCKKNTTMSSFASVDMNRFRKFQIPIPCPENPKKSLEIQSEIVRILDAFTSLTAELTAELTIRKKQYNYYRDKLLHFEYGEVEWRTLGEICDVYTGGEAPGDGSMSKTPTDVYKYPIYGNGADVYGFTDRYRIDKDAVTISSIGANTGTIYFRKAYFTPIIRLKVLIPKDDHILPRYIFHALSSISIGSKSSSVPNLNAADVKRISIPVPSVDKQARIVAILDKFDTLTNSISEGLPREIELRQKQYEYYRDLLLSFPKPEEVAA